MGAINASVCGALKIARIALCVVSCVLSLVCCTLRTYSHPFGVCMAETDDD